jgi:hypothetical protein
MTETETDRHTRPEGMDDATIDAVGAVSEALEWVERARGELYAFHQLMGRADLLLYGRWTFQIVEDFDDNYWSVFRDHERRVRDELQQGKRHIFESEMKERRRSRGNPGHERRP